jgi:hypothetical protein
VRAGSHAPQEGNTVSEKQHQGERILRLLRSYEGNWCPLPEILDLRIASHTRRIHELRKKYCIDMRDEWVDGHRYVWYRLMANIMEPPKEPEIYVAQTSEVA